MTRSPMELAWHPIALSQELSGEPLALRLLGRDLVGFRATSGRAVVLPGRCSHRGTALVRGEIRGECLVCPYHGWEFDASGHCVRIPSLGADRGVPRGAHLEGVSVVEQAGMVWVNFDQQADQAKIPVLPEAPEGLRAVTGSPMVWRTSAGRHLENILDLAHFPFVHPGTFGCPEAEVVEAHDVTPTQEGFVCDVGVTTLNPLGPAGRLYPTLGATIRLGYRYEVTVPYRITIRFAFPDGMRRELHEVICPNAPDQCTIYWLLLVDERLESDDEAELAFAQAVFAEDQPVIESQPPGVPLHRRDEVHVPADRLAVAYRQALRTWGCDEEIRA